MKILLLSALMLLLLSCATAPPSDAITRIPENEITLADALQDPEVFEQSIVRWGGRVLRADVIAAVDDGGVDKLRVEIANYPLNSDGKPLSEASAGARFIAYIKAGDESLTSLKDKVFKRNAFVTVVGQFDGTESLILANGNAQTIAVMNANDHYRWTYHDNNQQRNNSGVSFGIGIGISL